MSFVAPAIVRSDWSPNELLATREYRGPNRRVTTAGAEMSDLVTLRKVVMLCWKCRPKFNAAKARYVKKRTAPQARGRCDGCRTLGIVNMLFHIDTVQHI